MQLLPLLTSLLNLVAALTKLFGSSVQYALSSSSLHFCAIVSMLLPSSALGFIATISTIFKQVAFGFFASLIILAAIFLLVLQTSSTTSYSFVIIAPASCSMLSSTIQSETLGSSNDITPSRSPVIRALPQPTPPRPRLPAMVAPKKKVHFAHADFTTPEVRYYDAEVDDPSLESSPDKSMLSPKAVIRVRDRRTKKIRAWGKVKWSRVPVCSSQPHGRRQQTEFTTPDGRTFWRRTDGIIKDIRVRVHWADDQLRVIRNQQRRTNPTAKLYPPTHAKHYDFAPTDYENHKRPKKVHRKA